MRVLVVYAHPIETSYVAALRDAVLAGLAQSHHETRVIDLYAQNFDPRLSAQEHRVYEDESQNQITVAEHIALIRWAEGLVFVFPTWWYGLPAILKGWLDRTLAPGVAFTIDTRGGVIRPGLTHIRLIAGVTSCGSPWWFAKYVGEPHRRILMRGIGALCARRARKIWLAKFNMDRAEKSALARHLQKVEQRFARLT
ncbi:MAG: NAD(P)H-dependent oxidoreductase [Parvibaculum sp.]|nr:NAD(P)H-dependent oxidoreductase [Parvibaculum sp.]